MINEIAIRWVLKKFLNLEKQFETKSVKYSKELAEIIQLIDKLKDHEALISFHAKDPNIPLRIGNNFGSRMGISAARRSTKEDTMKRYTKLVRICV